MTNHKFNQLTFVTAERAGHRSGRSEISARHFLDFQVDSRSLSELVPEPGDKVTPFCREWPWEDVAECSRALRGEAHETKPDLAEDEVELLICAECGDLSCGELIVTIEVAERVVIWQRSRWMQAGPESWARQSTGRALHLQPTRVLAGARRSTRHVGQPRRRLCHQVS